MGSDIKITSSISCIRRKHIVTIVHKTVDYFESFNPKFRSIEFEKILVISQALKLKFHLAARCWTWVGTALLVIPGTTVNAPRNFDRWPTPLYNLYFDSLYLHSFVVRTRDIVCVVLSQCL